MTTFLSETSEHFPDHASSPSALKRTPPSRRRFLTTGVAAAMTMAAGFRIRANSANAALVDPDETSDLIGEPKLIVTTGDRTLLDVALEHDLGVIEISAANPGVDVWVPGKDQPILLPSQHLAPMAPHEGIVVNISELRLYYFPGAGQAPITHAIGIGREGFQTPIGTTSVIRKNANPTWYPTEATRIDKPELPAVVGPGPDNPLGNRAIYLGWPTYLIHGTNKPLGVGRRVSRGCIRLYPSSIEALFEMVPVGTPVRTVEQPIKIGRHRGELYIEAHPDFDQLDELEFSYELTVKPNIDITDMLVSVAGDDIDRVDWNVVQAELTNRRGVPTQISRPTLRDRVPDELFSQNYPATKVLGLY